MSLSETLTIRPLQRTEVGVLLQLIRALAEYEQRLDQVVASETDLERALFGEHATAKAVLACIDDTPIGYALFYPVLSTFRGCYALHLEDVFVLPEYRGQQVGYALMGYVAHEARAQGYPCVQWQVLGWNTPAIEFYHRLGAQPSETEWLPYKIQGEALERLADDFHHRFG